MPRHTLRRGTFGDVADTSSRGGGQHFVPFLVRACATPRRSTASTACAPCRARPSRSGCPSRPSATPNAPLSIDTALNGATTRSSAVVSAATSSKSFMRSSQSQRWICTPNRFSASRSSRLQSSYWRLTHVTPGVAKMPPHSSRRVYSRRRSAVWIFERQLMPTYGAGPDRREPFAPCGHAAAGSATRKERRSGNASMLGPEPANEAPGRDRAVEVVHGLAAQLVRGSARAPPALGNERGEQRHETRVALDDDLARRVDEVGIHRREHDLVADALFPVHEDAGVVVVPASSGEPARRARCRGARPRSRVPTARTPPAAVRPRAARSRGSRG